MSVANSLSLQSSASSPLSSASSSIRNRAGDVSQPKTEDVSQAKTEADCQKAGGMWDMNMCMEKKQSKKHTV